jgi:hypothetical protein
VTVAPVDGNVVPVCTRFSGTIRMISSAQRRLPHCSRTTDRRSTAAGLPGKRTFARIGAEVRQVRE